jgi:hypothetical protein
VVHCSGAARRVSRLGHGSAEAILGSPKKHLGTAKADAILVWRGHEGRTGWELGLELQDTEFRGMDFAPVSFPPAYPEKRTFSLRFNRLRT